MKKLLVCFVMVLCVFSFSGMAWCSVEGDWDIVGKMCAKVKIKGEGSAKEQYYDTDIFSFYPEGNFEMTDMVGTWEYGKKRFFIYLDHEAIEGFFEVGLSEELDATVHVNVTKADFRGKEKKDGTLKGKFKLVMHFYVAEYGMEGILKAKFKYLGTREGVAAQETLTDATLSFPFEGTVFDVLQGALIKAAKSE